MTAQAKCIFCRIVAGEAESSVVLDEDHLLAFMDIHPFRPGHVLVIPKRHEQYVGELRPEMQRDLFAAAVRIGQAVRRSTVPCDDLHFLVNDGRAANQTVPHVHMHVVPRRRGDLHRVIGGLAKRPAIALLRPTPRAELDRFAEAIAAELSG